MTKTILYTAALSSLIQILSTNAAKHHPPAFAFLPPSHQHHQYTATTKATKAAVTKGINSPVPPLFSTLTDEIPSDAPLDTTTTTNPQTSSSSSSYDPEATLQARNKLLALSQTLASNSPTGKFISRPSDKIKLQKSIAHLEALINSNNSSNNNDRFKEMMVGDWTLIATANLPSSAIRRRMDETRENKRNDTNKNNALGLLFKKNKNNGEKKRRSGLSLFGREGRPLNPIQESIRKSISVTQRIRGDDGADATTAATTTTKKGGNSVVINRVDNVIEYTPLDTLESIIPKESPLFGILGEVNVNPLKVKQSKVVLVHKAEVESVDPVLRTKISLTSTVLNVAGSSQFFDPEGADILGLNNIFGEFLNVGTFDTPYVDEDIRISRTSGPVFEQLRVFVRKGSQILQDEGGMLDALTAEMRVEEEVEVGTTTITAADIGDAANEITAQVKKVADAAQNVYDAVTTMEDNVRSAVEKDMDGVNRAMGDAMNDVVERVQDVVEDDLKQLGDAVAGVQLALQQERGDVVGAITNVTKVVRRIPEDVKTVVDEDIADVGEAVEEALDAMVKDVQDSVEEDLKQIETSVKGVRNAVSGEDDEEEEPETVEEAEEKEEESVVEVEASAEEVEIIEKMEDEDIASVEEAVENAIDDMLKDVQDSAEAEAEDVSKE